LLKKNYICKPCKDIEQELILYEKTLAFNAFGALQSLQGDLSWVKAFIFP